MQPTLLHICKTMRNNIYIDRKKTLKRDSTNTLKHSAIAIIMSQVISLLTRTNVPAQVAYYMGSAIEIHKVHYSKERS